MNNKTIGNKSDILANRADLTDYEIKLKSIANMPKKKLDAWVTSTPAQTVLLMLARVVWALTKVVLKIWRQS